MKPRCVLLSFLVLIDPSTSFVSSNSTSEQVEFFEKNIRPVLADNCFKCHSSTAKRPKGGLLLDSREGLLKGGDSGPAVVPGQPDKSRLIEAVQYQNVDLQMPPKGKLPAQVIADLSAWVKMGAPWPTTRAEGPGARGEKADSRSFDLQRRKQAHWSWQPLRPPGPPEVKNKSWPRNAVDHFILAKLEGKSLEPAPAADKRALIRRIYFDLLGLPPPPALVDAFVKDASPGALETLVDRLLASPHFGERWGRHWLDLVRYGESRGHEFDYTNPNAYQYRDYVIRALNADLPYNQFVIEHIAGDLIEKPRLHPVEGFNESILGTGFWFLGEQVHSPVDICQDKADRFDNMLDVMSKTFLGLTVACARCHDHKFDAISTKDYYALFGFLESSSYRLAPFDALEHNRQIAQKLWKWRDRSRLPMQRALAETTKPGLGNVADYLLGARGEGRGARKTLDADLLGRWITYLSAAVKDRDDPLHGWALVASAKTSRSPAELLYPLVQEWLHQAKVAGSALAGAEVVVDYRKPRPDTWMPDGVAFGPGPVRPGDVHLGSTAAKPIIKFFEYAAAEKDAIGDGLQLAPGAESDPGALSFPRHGRTLRTPVFEVSRGKVFSLVKGAGRGYASIDGHVMIAGPLHAQLVASYDAGTHFRWIEHDLTAYKGRRAHIEYTPTGNAEFAVALVVQSDRTPASLEQPNESLLSMFAGKDAASPEALAHAYQRLLSDVVERLGSDRVVGSADSARLANWLLRHQDLLVATKGGRIANPSYSDTAKVGRISNPSCALDKTVLRLLAEQAKLVAGIKHESRLALAMMDGTGVDENVFIRGSYKTPGPKVPRRFLEALAGPGKTPAAHGSGRLDLAMQMVDPAVDPFLPRVLVNRLWHHLFGRGIVASVDNFGVLGDLPTHPELLDFLADRFIKEGWSVKKMIRLMVLSRTYQMASHAGTKAEQADPENLLLQRMRLRRLEGEAIRDAMLAVSGRLDRSVYGPPVPVHLTSFQDGRGRPASGPLDGNGRRSLYLSVRRNFLPSLLLAFDTPIPFSTVGRRSVSNVPAQALILLNDPFVHQQAEVWARKLLAEKRPARERIIDMYRTAFARPPDEQELAACLEFVERHAHLDGVRASEMAAWKDLAHVLFNAKEFIFIQ